MSLNKYDPNFIPKSDPKHISSNVESTPATGQKVDIVIIDFFYFRNTDFFRNTVF